MTICIEVYQKLTHPHGILVWSTVTSCYVNSIWHIFTHLEKPIWCTPTFLRFCSYWLQIISHAALIANVPSWISHPFKADHWTLPPSTISIGMPLSFWWVTLENSMHSSKCIFFKLQTTETLQQITWNVNPLHPTATSSANATLWSGLSFRHNFFSRRYGYIRKTVCDFKTRLKSKSVNLCLFRVKVLCFRSLRRSGMFPQST